MRFTLIGRPFQSGRMKQRLPYQVPHNTLIPINHAAMNSRIMYLLPQCLERINARRSGGMGALRSFVQIRQVMHPLA